MTKHSSFATLDVGVTHSDDWMLWTMLVCLGIAAFIVCIWLPLKRGK